MSVSNKVFFRKAALFTAVAIVLSACGGSESTKGNTSSAPEAASHDGKIVHSGDKNRVVIGNGAEPSSLDPQKTSDGAAFNILRQMFVGLVSADEDGKLIPGLAEKWDNENDTVWTFHLRDAKWSNGEPITAHDFVYSLRRLVDPATASYYGSYLVDAKLENAQAVAEGKAKPDTLGVRALDDKTLQIRLSHPVPYLPELLLLPATFAVNQKNIEAHGDKWVSPQNIVVSGPYKLKEWVVNGHVLLERNKAYYDDAKTSIQEGMFLPVTSTSTEATRYQAGEIDMTYGAPADQFQALKAEFGRQLKSNPRLCTSYFEFNHSKAPFNDVKVRKALSLVLDRDTVAQKVLGRGEAPAYQFTPLAVAGVKKYTPEWSGWNQQKRIDEAKKLLNEAGYNEQKPLRFELLYSTSESAKRQVTAMASMWKQAVPFIDAQPLNQEWKTSLDTRRNGNYTMAYAAWCADYNEQSSFLNLFRTGNPNNSGKYADKAYDALLDSTLAAGVTPEKRADLYLDAEKRLDNDAAALFVVNWVNTRLVSPKIKGFSEKDATDYWQLKNWSFEK